jgi:hypothetical protein
MKAHAALAIALVTSLPSIAPAHGESAAAPTGQTTARPSLTTAEWRIERERQLKDPDGWLAIAGLFFLDPGVNTVGSDPASDIVLPPGAGPASAGRIVLVDGEARLELNAGVAATFNNEPIAAPVVLRLADTKEKR